MRKYKICSNCVMDTSDPSIIFDDLGVCDHCNTFRKQILPGWDKEQNTDKIDILSMKIKKAGRNKDFDCIIGLSGGIDSSYLAYIAVKKMGLRPLLFHVDAGWNSQQAVNNIEQITERLNLDLYTEVIDWEEMKDFQLAWFKSGLPHIDIPQDHAFVATLYNFASKHNIKYILNGGNISTECVRNPMEFLYYGTDMTQIRDIIGRFSTREYKTYPFSSVLRHKFYLRWIRGIKVVRPLNYRPYLKSDALSLLEKEYGWKPYPQKHFESRFTKFYEGYWLPERFGFDTRRVQYSSLILTNQMTREEAINKISKPAYDESTITNDFEYIATKLDISIDELLSLHKGPNKSWRDYKSRQGLIEIGTKAQRILGIQRAIIR